jgi:hypothetical protein
MLARKPSTTSNNQEVLTNKKTELGKTNPLKGLDLKHKNAEYLIISSPSKKKKKSDYSSEMLGLAANYNNIPWMAESYQETKDG